MRASLPPVTVGHIELVRVRMPLVRPFTTSFGTQSERDVLFVQLRDPDGVEGWGECATTAAPLYNEEFTDGASLMLAAHLVPAVLAAGGGKLDAVTLPSILAHLRGNRTAKAALEVAVWDLQLRRAGRSLAEHLGVTRDRVPAGVSVGIPGGGAPALVDQVQEYLDAGYRRVKCKVAPGFDVEPMTALREAIGDDVLLLVDANAGYEPEDPDHVRALDGLDELGLAMIEQPFAPQRLYAHAVHARRWSTPICLDESLQGTAEVADALDLGACTIVNLKIGRVGGLVEAVGIHDLCLERGVPLWCGGMLETGIGRNVNVALAGLPGCTLPGDVSASDRYWAQDVTAPFVLVDGHLEVPRSPGACRIPDPDHLDAWTTQRTRLH